MWDAKENFNRKKSERNNIHVQKLQQTIRSCGVSFEVWEKRSEDGKGSSNYDFTSLLGDDKKKLLVELPGKLHECIHPETCQRVVDLWVSFHKLYGIITDKNSSNDMVTSYFNMARCWVKKIALLGDKLHCYKRSKVTPYMHCMVFHIPMFMEKYNSIKLFTGQGVEKNNDVARKIVLCKSNKREPAVDVLKLESRQRNLRECECLKRSYVKRNSVYWETDIKEKRKRSNNM